jgi:hypothetical protein
MSSDHETDSSVENIKSWEVESLSSVDEFDDYSKALDLFNIKSNQDEEPILYEIQKSNISGSIIKRIPILNIKQSKKRKEELEKKKLPIQSPNQEEQKKTSSQTKNKPQGIKYRIVILVIIIVAFLILLYVLSQLVTSSDTLNAHFSLGQLLKKNSDISLIA